MAKMQAGDVHPTAIEVFRHYYAQLESGATGLVREADLEPLTNPAKLSDLDIDDAAAATAMRATVVIKLNGGLGTGMGMDRAKTLLEVRDGLTFLDIIARQVLHARKRVRCAPAVGVHGLVPHQPRHPRRVEGLSRAHG